MRKGESLLTSKQLKILKLRCDGHTQAEVAKMLGTSRVSVSITEKRARENVERARKTLEAFELLDPVKLGVKKGADLFVIPEMIFREADKHGIDVIYNKTSLIGILRRKAGDRINGNRVTGEIDIFILRGGKVVVS